MTAVELAEVPPLETFEEELRNRRLVNYIPRLSPRYMAPYHLAPLLERFELAVKGIPQRVCCSAPPRFAKTESVLHVPPYMLRRHPEKTFSYSTYGDRLSRKGSRTAKKLVRREGIDVHGNVNEWRTAEGGGLLAGGTGGPLTGYGVDIAVVDDPIKFRMEAESPAFRERLSDWFHDVLLTRIEPGGSVFVFMTRWHPDDLIGELINEGFESLSFPAINRDGQTLWPERWSLAEMQAKREAVGEFTWSSLYQQEPRAKGERVFGDCHVFTSLPVVYQAAGGIDSSYSQKKTADYSAWVKMLRQGDQYYIVDGWRGRCPMPQFRARLREVHSNESTMRWRWYVATSEMGAAELLADPDDADFGVPVTGERAYADKFIRAQKFAAAWNAGRVFVPASAPWLDDLLKEIAAFTGINDKRDDFIDAVVAAFDELESGASNTGPVTTSTAPHQPLRDARI